MQAAGRPCTHQDIKRATISKAATQGAAVALCARGDRLRGWGGRNSNRRIRPRAT